MPTRQKEFAVFTSIPLYKNDICGASWSIGPLGGHHTESEHTCQGLFSPSHGARYPGIERLLNGAGVFPYDLRAEGLNDLARWLVEQRITIFHSVPTVFQYFCSTLSGKETFPNLRLIRLGGEPVFKRHVDLYKQHFSAECVLANELGSTETGGTAQFLIGKATKLEEGKVPSGYPLEDMEVLLLDDAGDELGYNDVGEIAIRSRYLALGYWGRPSLTKSAFLPDPRGGDARIYRTGDIGCLRPDGCLVHLGRKDSQVKIRGHRIELTDVEAALFDAPGIKQAVVLARKDDSGEKRLVAYIVTDPKKPPTTGELRSFLADRLPDHMIPTVFVPIDALPQTLSGKVDRRSILPPSLAPNHACHPSREAG
ncbi:MAG: AMP-binding protein [Chloroflexi bacterium]|nr:AMP-binding protein [Chloroflexota bacterium]